MIKKLESSVLEEANNRIIRAFSSGLPIYLSISGGKDSICLTNLIYELISNGKINKDQLTVLFVDEEAMFDDVIDIVFKWREKFLKIGVEFYYFCIETKHYNCLNQLENDMTFITWDRYKKNDWVRQMPDFAITSHELLNPRTDTYQDFLTRIVRNGISFVGLRMSESIQRRKSLATSMAMGIKDKIGDRISKNNYVYPIYDWKDKDIWKYIYDKGLDFPRTYMNLYQVGVSKGRMRISQFFSIDTARVLVKLNEYEPELMNKVIKREPNAYLVSLYWDSSLFRRGDIGRRTDNQVEKNIDYRKETIELLKSKKLSDGQIEVANAIKRRVLIPLGAVMNNKHWKNVYNTIIAGDPKGRTVRAMGTGIYSDLLKKSKKELLQTKLKNYGR